MPGSQPARVLAARGDVPFVGTLGRGPASSRWGPAGAGEVRVLVEALLVARTSGSGGTPAPAPSTSQAAASVLKRSAGRFQSSVLRGRSLISTATRCSSSASNTLRSVPLGK